MKGTIKSTQTENGQETNSTIDISGQYVGPCDANATINRTLPVAAQRQGLDVNQNEGELQAAAKNATNKPKKAPTLDDVNNADSTTNNVKNTFNGLRSLLGR